MKTKAQTPAQSKKMFQELDKIFLDKPQHTQGEWDFKTGCKLKTPTWSKPNQIIPTGVDEQDIIVIKIKGEEGSGIAYVFNWDGNQLENAKRIVKAVNMHDDLIDALKSVIEYHDKDLLPVLKLSINKMIEQAERK